MALRNNTRLVRILTIASLATLLLLILPTFDAVGQGGSSPTVDSTIWGHVYDGNGNFLSNLTMVVDREYYIGNNTKTDIAGYYRMDIPAGKFILRILDDQGFIVYRLDFLINNSQVKRLDFEIDTNADQSRIFGSIHHKWTLSPMNDAEVDVYRVDGPISVFAKSVKTNDNGKFEIMVPAGEYKLEVKDEGQRFYKVDSFSLNFSEEKEFDLNLEAPSALFTPGNVLNLIKHEYIQILLMIVTVFIGLFLLAYLDRIFKLANATVRKKPSKFINKDLIDFGEKVVKWNILILMFIVLAFLVAQILDIITTLWIPVRNSIASIYTIILFVVFMRTSLMIWKQAVNYMKGDHGEETHKQILSPRMITFIEIIGKYVIAFLFLVAIIVTALAALGMSDLIIGGFFNGLYSNAGFIIFFVSLIVISYVISKFVTSFFDDLKGKTTRFRPEMIEVAGKGVKYFIYTIIGMISMFTILSAAGMGEIGQTLIIVFSMILGLVVSMAATGSIGNLLSGLIIMSFKPFDEGDWVVVADKHQGEIIELNIMFTKMRDLEDELIEIPNNLILSQGIVNWTTAAKKGGFAVEVDTTIGYDVPAKQVIKLMEDSTKDVPGIVTTKKSHVVTTEFYDHAIGYKLRAFIRSPTARNKIRTALMVNMQKTFTENGVEILSPVYEIGRMERTPSQEEIKKRLKKIKIFE